MRPALTHAAAGLVGGALAWLVGVTAGPSPSTPAPVPPVAPSAELAPAPAAPTRATSSAAADPADCLCGSERRVHDALLARARRDAYGAPATWPADAGVHAPEVVRDVLERAAAECGEGAELQVVDCEEPPCTGVFRLGEGTGQAFRLQTCAPWLQAYEGSAALAHVGVECGDERVQMLLIAPPWPIAELSPDLDPADYDARLRHRSDVLAEAACP